MKEELVQVGMRAGIIGHFKQRHEDVVKYFTEIGHHLVGSEYIAIWRQNISS